MVAFFSHREQLFVLSYMIVSMILSAYTAPVTQSTKKFIKRGDFFLPPTNYALNGNYNAPKYRSDNPGQTHKSTQQNSERITQKSHSQAQPAIARWTGLGEMRKTSLKRTGSQQDLWWQGSNHDSEGNHKRKKNGYNFHSAK